ncbi:MAG: adenylate/guanylate cyclase domain-containing protein [Chloroflexi bacterium]|nr:adenylate/guanylate cyclase domain-containing protein [Chloroflexota bacterium]
MRGSTTIAEKVGPVEFAGLLNRFYEVAMSALIPKRAIIDKMIGDEVMAFFVPAAKIPMQDAAMDAAMKILKGVGYGTGEEPWLPVGIGINHGKAYVGKVGTDDVNDFTALGDTVNTASRLQSEAKAGQIVVSESIYSEIITQYPNVPVQNIDVRGKEEKFGVHVIAPFD